MTRFLLVAALFGCGSQSAQEPSGLEHEEPETAIVDENANNAGPNAEDDDGHHDDDEAGDPRALCLPLVDGCGCSSMCAQGERRVEGDQYMITHDGQDSRLDQATLGRHCFDERGASSPDDGTRSGCVDTFQRGRCGGGCIPTPAPTCRIVDGSCVRVDDEHAQSWEHATFRVSFGGGAQSGTLRLLGDRYEYVGNTAPPSEENFYFVEHRAGAFNAEHRDDPRTVGLVHFDADRPGYDANNPRRTLEVRRDDDGTYWMHSIVSEFQRWSIRAQ